MFGQLLLDVLEVALGGEGGTQASEGICGFVEGEGALALALEGGGEDEEDEVVVDDEEKMGRSLRTIKRIKDEDDEDYKFIVRSLGAGTKQGPLKMNELF